MHALAHILLYIVSDRHHSMLALDGGLCRQLSDKLLCRHQWLQEHTHVVSTATILVRRESYTLSR